VPSELDRQEECLIDAVADGSVPSDKLRERLQKMAVERFQLEKDRQSSSNVVKQAVELLSAVLHFLGDPQAMYQAAADLTRRRMNDAFFEALYLRRDIVEHAVLKPVFAEVVEAYAAHRRSKEQENPAGALQPISPRALTSTRAETATLSDVLTTDGGLDWPPVRELHSWWTCGDGITTQNCRSEISKGLSRGYQRHRRPAEERQSRSKLRPRSTKRPDADQTSQQIAFLLNDAKLRLLMHSQR
jgi:hypothetical protein